MKALESDIHYFDYLNFLPQPVIITDHKGVVIFSNKTVKRVFDIDVESLLLKKISDFIIHDDSDESYVPIFRELKSGEREINNLLFKKANGSYININISVSGIHNDQKELTSAIFLLTRTTETSTKLKRLERISKTLASLGTDYQTSINRLTDLCGELLEASASFYNRLHEGMLKSFGAWNAPNGYKFVDKPEGHICYDVIKLGKNEILYVNNLHETSYYQTDPNVIQFGLKSYLGHVVRLNGEPVGSLCVVFDHEYHYTEADNYLINVLAMAIESIETRESLRNSQISYKELFNFAYEGIIICTPEGIIKAANNSIQKLSGFQNEELIGHQMTEVLFSERSLKETPFDHTQLQKGKKVVKEREIQCKNKKLITVEMHSQLMPNNDIQTVLFDITTRKESEAKLQLSENTYRGIINSVSDAIYILDKTGNFLDVNTAAENLYNYDKKYFIGKTPEFLSAPGLNDMEQTIKNLHEAYDGKHVRYEFWGLRKDGSIFPKEISLSPGKWYGQNVVVAVGRNITERKKIEDLQRVSEEKYRLLVQYSSDPIFSYNPDETYRFVNEAFASPFGKKPEDIIGKTPFEIFPKQEAEKRLKLIREVLKSGEKGEIEVKVVTNQGEEKYYLTLVDPIKDISGNVLWVTCIAKDITHRKKAEEELKLKNEQLNAINAEKDKFFSIVAHDLRGPMNGFLGLTGILTEDIENLSLVEITEIATTMRTSAVNIYRLIENLLEWSKMQRGTMNFEPQPIFLKSSLAKSIELMRDTANNKEIELQINIQEYAVVFADLHMLETVIRNLVSNAIKFSYRGGIVNISASKTENKMICVEVQDSGTGMNPDLANKLFKLTENTNRKGTEGEPSSGLGLILCKEFVEKHGGKIWVESVEGKGSSFFFTLPQS